MVCVWHVPFLYELSFHTKVVQIPKHKKISEFLVHFV